MSCRKAVRGASLPETAIVMALVLALLFGIMDFGRYMYTYAFVAQLARQGARWAIVRGSVCTLLDHCNASSGDVQTYVRSLNEGATNSGRINATATWPTCPPGSSGKAPGCSVLVTVTYDFNFIAVPLLPSTTYHMASTSQMVVSQ